MWLLNYIVHLLPGNPPSKLFLKLKSLHIIPSYLSVRVVLHCDIVLSMLWLCDWLIALYLWLACWAVWWGWWVRARWWGSRAYGRGRQYGTMPCLIYVLYICVSLSWNWVWILNGPGDCFGFKCQYLTLFWLVSYIWMGLVTHSLIILVEAFDYKAPLPLAFVGS